MHRLATWAIVAALVVLATVAAADAVRARSASLEVGAVRADADVAAPRPRCAKAVAASFRGEGGLVPCERRPARRPVL